MSSYSKILVVSLGQGGNQLADSFFETLLSECGVSSDGYVTPKMAENLEIFCDRGPDGRLSPRRIDVVLEKQHHAYKGLKVGKYANLYKQNNIIVSSISDDTPLSWPAGYNADCMNTVFNVVSQQIEAIKEECIIWLFHSFGGVCGAGGGSWLAQQLAGEYPDIPRLSIAIAPSPKVSDHVIEPYNAALSLFYCLTHMHTVVMIDNEALYDMCFRTLRLSTPNFGDLNRLAANALTTLVSPLIWPNVAGERMSLEVFNTTIGCLPDQVINDENHIGSISNKLLSLGSWPLKAPTNENVKSLVQALLTQQESLFLRAKGNWKSAFCVFHGHPIDDSDIGNTLPINWRSACGLNGSMSGVRAVALGQHTGMVEVLKQISEQYSAMFRRKMYLHMFTSLGMDDMEFTEAESFLNELIRNLNEL